MKKNLPIMVALGAPLVFIIGVIVYVNLLVAPIEPKHDFVMTNEKDVLFIDDQGKLKVREDRLRSIRGLESIEDIKLWRYDMKMNELKDISLEEAQKLHLHEGELSPDGMRVEYRHSNRDLFDIFVTRRDGGYYIYNVDGAVKLNMGTRRYWEKEIIGWVISFN